MRGSDAVLEHDQASKPTGGSHESKIYKKWIEFGCKIQKKKYTGLESGYGFEISVFIRVCIGIVLITVAEFVMSPKKKKSETSTLHISFPPSSS